MPFDPFQILEDLIAVLALEAFGDLHHILDPHRNVERIEDEFVAPANLGLCLPNCQSPI